MTVSTRFAATHRWMGRALGALPDEELRAILRTLEVVAFGRARAPSDLCRDEVVRQACELDLMLDRERRELGRIEQPNGRRPERCSPAQEAVL